MKKLFAALTILAITTTVSAQEKRWEHNIYTGVGLFVEDYGYGSETGLSSKIGYGLNYHIRHAGNSVARTYDRHLQIGRGWITDR